ncbi:hypothetical protein HOLleu_03103 [Holothuria leucospilota]|uniref:OTU domain-containing protein n=1 Tax=Holothuria leucospilota TaxID=206669 RepID=A0A9Q1HLN6_HOLLE|nr:hypothetical protein HOLleu_03103 [Holothuria leucospilota]
MFRLPSSDDNKNQVPFNVSKDSETSEVVVVTTENSIILHYFPVDLTWANAVAETLSLSHTPSSNSSAVSNYNSSPIYSTVSAKPICVHTIEGDGNCFFRSLLYLITESEEHHILRDLTVKDHQSEWKSWHETLQTMEQDWREFVDIDGIDSTSLTSEQQQNVLTDAETEMEPDSDDEWTEVK